MIRRRVDKTVFVPQALWVRHSRRVAMFQIGVLVGLLLLFGWLVSNLAQNLRLLGVETGYGFLSQPANYDINQTLIEYTATSPHWLAGLAGLLNTLLVSVCGIALATMIGFVAGVLRLSRNWLLNRLMAAYIEFTRNVPVLLHILLWYGLIINTLPHPRRALEPLTSVYLSNRGFYLPEPVFHPGFGLVAAALVLSVPGAWLLARYAAARRARTGKRTPIAAVNALLVVALPLGTFMFSGRPLGFEWPAFEGFNFQGGLAIKPEFAALWLGLSLYTSAFIAENVRAGIQSVDHGQVDAARALGLRGASIMRWVVLPQAMRVIVPPLIGQYLNLIKNSSLAIAIGYMDLVATIGGISLNQTGRALECMSIVLGVYLMISLSVSALMNLYNHRTALVEH